MAYERRIGYGYIGANIGAVAKTGRYTLTEVQGASVLRALRKLLDERQGNVSELARDLELSQPSTWRLLNEKTRAGLPTAERTAALCGISVSTLLGHVPPTVTMATPASHPHLFEALGLVGDRVPAVAREATVAAASYLPDLAATTWIALLADSAHSAERGPASAPAPSSRAAASQTMRIPVVKRRA